MLYMDTNTPPEVWCGQDADSIRSFDIDHKVLSRDIFAAISGPDVGIQLIDDIKSGCKDSENNNAVEGGDRVDRRGDRRASGITWDRESRKAYSICTSLYDQNPVTGRVSGDPIADCYAFLARKNNSLLVVADGVNWGEKSRIAARCAVDAAISFIHQSIFIELRSVKTTREVLLLMREAFDEAHDSIIKHEGGLTTLNVTMVLPLAGSSQYAVCSVNVGDSLTYVYSKRFGMNELSIGSHDITLERDLRNAGGALGPVNGKEPYLVNLTFSVTTCNAGDLVFVTTDGISDNFDPVVMKLAVPGKKDSLLSSVNEKAEMLPHERHLFSMKGMELAIHEYELENEYDISAQDLCIALRDHVVRVTQSKRSVIENPELYNRKYKTKERKKLEDQVRKTLQTLPGKLDHATVVAYEAGLYRDETTPNTGYMNVCSSCSSKGSASSLENSSISSSSTEPSSSAMFESNV